MALTKLTSIPGEHLLVRSTDSEGSSACTSKEDKALRPCQRSDDSTRLLGNRLDNSHIAESGVVKSFAIAYLSAMRFCLRTDGVLLRALNETRTVSAVRL